MPLPDQSMDQFPIILRYIFHSSLILFVTKKSLRLSFAKNLNYVDSFLSLSLSLPLSSSLSLSLSPFLLHHKTLCSNSY